MKKMGENSGTYHVKLLSDDMQRHVEYRAQGTPSGHVVYL